MTERRHRLSMAETSVREHRHGKAFGRLLLRNRRSETSTFSLLLSEKCGFEQLRHVPLVKTAERQRAHVEPRLKDFVRTERITMYSLGAYSDESGG